MTYVTIQDDFAPEKIAVSGQCFRAEVLGESVRFIAADKVLYIKPCLTNSKATQTENQWEVSCTNEEWKSFWQPYFDLQRNYEAVRAAIPAEDAYLCRAAADGCGIRVLRQDPFEMLITFIISQRKSIPAIKKCVEALCELCGEEIETEQGSIRTFPTPEALAAADEEALARCSMGYRTPYVRDAARGVAQGLYDLCAIATLSDEELLAALMQIRGVGKKVANCVALFAYGRVECAPVDVWIERVIAERYAGENPFPCYGNAGILQQYMFYDAQMTKKRGTPPRAK